MKFVRPVCPSCSDGRLLRETVGDGSTHAVCDTCTWREASLVEAEAKGCRVDRCRRPLKGHGLCRTHYMRWYKAGKPEVSRWLKAGASEGGER